MTVLRPWGQIDWLLERLAGRSWSLIGCCGTEKRSIALPMYLGRGMFGLAEIVTIRDPDPLDARETEACLRQQHDKLIVEGYSKREIYGADLLTTMEEKRRPLERIKESGERSVLIDISSFPKSWFFPMIKIALEDDWFCDVVVTYTSGSSYSDQLSENMLGLQTIPGFYSDGVRKRHDSLIAGVGFEAGGLVQLLEAQASDSIRLIFPFPPGPPGHWRNWKVVRHLEDSTQRNIGRGDSQPTLHRVHVHMYDCPQVFEALCEMTDDGTLRSAIGPYGPKTISLAMCLFSLAAARSGRPRVPVYYTQPTRYALDYTGNVRRNGEIPVITGYCLRLGGRDLYTLPTTVG